MDESHGSLAGFWAVGLWACGSQPRALSVGVWANTVSVRSVLSWLPPTILSTSVQSPVCSRSGDCPRPCPCSCPSPNAPSAPCLATGHWTPAWPSVPVMASGPGRWSCPQANAPPAGPMKPRPFVQFNKTKTGTASKTGSPSVHRFHSFVPDRPFRPRIPPCPLCALRAPSHLQTPDSRLLTRPSGQWQ